MRDSQMLDVSRCLCTLYISGENEHQSSWSRNQSETRELRKLLHAYATASLLCQACVAV